MNNARWYPTSTTLPNGDALVISGYINSGTVNVEPQVWQTATASWRNLSTAHLALPFYPFMFVAPNGKVFCAGPSPVTRYLDVTGTGAWSLVGNSNYGTRNWGSSVMYDDGKVLIMGGSPCGFYDNSCTTLPTATAEIIDLNSSTPAWNYTQSMVTGGRRFHTATLLPDGKVLVSGGTRGYEGASDELEQSSIRVRDVGSGDRYVDNDGEPEQISRLSLRCPALARWPRFVGRRNVRRSLSRNIFASLFVQRLPPNYHVGTYERCIWAVVFRRHTQRHKHFKGDIDRAFFRDTQL